MVEYLLVAGRGFQSQPSLRDSIVLIERAHSRLTCPARFGSITPKVTTTNCRITVLTMFRGHRTRTEIRPRGLRPGSPPRRRALLALMALLVIGNTGCGIHYYDAKAGRDHLFGLGQLSMSENELANDQMSVASRSRIAGLKFDLGRKGFGVTLGYDVRQRIEIAPAGGIVVRKPGPAWPFSIPLGSGWTFGHTQMTASTGTHRPTAVLSGSGVAGLGLDAGRRRGLALGFSSEIETTVWSENTFLETRSRNRVPWPYLDVFDLEINTAIPIAHNAIEPPQTQ